MFEHRTLRRMLPVLFLAVGFATGCGDSSSAPPADTLTILVSNDDGYASEGIDAIVEALVADPRNQVIVSAPSGNRSGSGDQTGPSPQCGNLSVETLATRSGYPATAVDGCPADAVNYALANLYPAGTRPDVVIAGINEGQNVSEVVATQISGTVGAAKTAARSGIPALASSQGIPGPGGFYDYPAGVQAVLAWLAAHRAALAAGSMPPGVDSVNIPSCNAGSIRGTIVGLPLAPTPAGAFGTQDCESTLEDPDDDVQAFVNGFIPVTAVPFE
ncbi:MAG: 5'/3'-nucleotidase SurE [Alphaproteobacteria bacterium]